MKATRIGFADNYGTTCEIQADDGEITFEVGVGMCYARGYPTPGAARQVAAALLDAADDAEREEPA